MKGGPVNAFTLPGGILVFYSDLIDRARDGNEVAGVLAHEMGHVMHYHAIKGLARQYGMDQLLKSMTGGFSDLGTVGQGGSLLLALRNGRSFERDADATGVGLLQKLGLRADGVAGFFEHMLEDQPRDPASAIGIWSSHPPTAERIAANRRPATGKPAFSDAEWTALRAVCGSRPPPPARRTRHSRRPPAGGSVSRLVGQPGDDRLHVLVAQHVLDEARHLAVGPVAHLLGAAQQLAEGVGLEVVDRVHRLAEIGTLLALARAVEAVAGDAERHIAVEPAPGRMGGRQVVGDVERGPALVGAVGDLERGELVDPVFRADLAALGVLPDQEEGAGRLLALVGDRRPRRASAPRWRGRPAAGMPADRSSSRAGMPIENLSVAVNST